MNPLKPAARTQIPRQHMPEQDATARATNFGEVNLGLDFHLAKTEAARCLECASPKCVAGCPVGVKVKDFVALVLDGKYLEAAAKVREDNVLPAVTGRVCPQEEQCEGACVMTKKFGAVGIGYLERFVADYERQSGQIGIPAKAPPSGHKVAIIGSGPAGLSAAGDLVLRGHAVTVFEALHEIGGVLVYGIPEFRLPKDIVRQEVDTMRRMGVAFETDVVVGQTVTVDELLHEEGYRAVLVATGAGLPQFLGIPGENLCGVYSANEFLTRVNLMKAYQPGTSATPIFDCRDRQVAVVGGGNTAMDAIRSAKRLGAKRAHIIYRRSEAEMPARREEIKHAKEEGIELLLLNNPVEFLGDDKGWLRAAKLQKMELGPADESGRRRPVAVKGSEYELPLDVVIIAVGTSSNPLVQSTTPDIQTRKGGYIAADPVTLKTSKRGVFAAGDIVTGAATVILAMGAGRTAAKAIDEYLKSGQW